LLPNDFYFRGKHKQIQCKRRLVFRSMFNVVYFYINYSLLVASICVGSFDYLPTIQSGLPMF